jgi:hypothetical protein
MLVVLENEIVAALAAVDAAKISADTKTAERLLLTRASTDYGCASRPAIVRPLNCGEMSFDVRRSELGSQAQSLKKVSPSVDLERVLREISLKQN